jgi:hypothetical protein
MAGAAMNTAAMASTLAVADKDIVNPFKTGAGASPLMPPTRESGHYSA